MPGTGDKTLQEKEVLSRWLQRAEENDAEPGETENGTDDRQHEDAVFKHSYIPRRLNDVYDPDRDVDVLSRGEGKNLIYADTIGLVQPSSNVLSSQDTPVEGKEGNVGSVRFVEDGVRKVSLHDEHAPDVSVVQEENAESSDEEGDESGNSESDSLEATDEQKGTHRSTERKPRGHKHEDKELKKERKKAVKEEARERRKHKMPKSEKKKRVKATRHS